MIYTLGLWEPWASAIREGHKRIETRSWSTNHRGWMVIIAVQTQNAITRQAEKDFEHLELTLHRGRAVALVKISEVRGLTTWEDRLWVRRLLRDNPKEHSLGDYSGGRFAWIFNKVIPLKPFAAKAGQRLRRADDRMKEELLKQLRYRKRSRRW